jgi:hypothetical protein
MLPPERWALTPPFHPCQTERAFRRRLAGFPARCHRASLGRRYILCGTFREQWRRLKSVPTLPWRYQARCPISSPALASLRRRCPDFPPAQPSCDDQASDHPAHPPIQLYLGNWRFGGPKTRRISVVKRRVPDLRPPVLFLIHFQSVQANSGKAHTRVHPTKRPAGYSFRGRAVQTLRR